jgi:putative aldouronate transport system permease protein
MTAVQKRAANIRWAFYIMLIPGFVFTLIYSYGPMMGLVIAFQRFEPSLGMFGSSWIGLENFRHIFGLRDFNRALRNTVYIASFKIIFNLSFAILVAILLNEMRHIAYKRTIQTMVYLPFFISWVIISGIFLDLLSPSSGLVNQVIGFFGFEPIFFMGNPRTFPWVIIITDVWKGFGMGTILYLAAITGIDPNLYEAASIDGANRLHRILYITLPGMTAIIVLNATLSLGNVLNAGFDQVVNMYNPTVYSTGDIIDTMVYRVGIQGVRGALPRYEIATAVGMFKSLVSFVLVGGAYYAAYRIADYRIF